MKILKDELTPKERAILYKSGKEVDRLPCSFSLSETAPVMYGLNISDYYYSSEMMIEMERNLARDFNVDSMGVGLGLRGIGEALGSKLKYPKDSVSFVVEPVLKDYSMLDSLDIIDPYKDGRMPAIIEALKVLTDEFSNERFIGSSLAGPISNVVAIRGAENILKDTVKNKANLHKLLKYTVKCMLRYTEVVYKECGSNVSLAEPVASSNLISLTQFKEFVKPYLEEFVLGVKEITGSAPSIHICGKTKDRWQDLVDVGLSAFSVDNCEDLEEVKKAIGNSMGISGNVPPVEIMRNGSINDVMESVKECILKGSDNPCGFTLSPGCQIPVGTPIENIHAFMNAARMYSKNAVKGKLCTF